MSRLVIVALCLSGLVRGADPEPFDFQRVYAAPPGGKLVSLPSEPAKTTAGTAAIAAARSALRFREGQVPPLIIRYRVGGTLTGGPRLYRLQPEPGRRTVPLGRWAYSAADRQEPGAVPIRMERYGKVSYRLVPPAVLRPGEYAISTNLGADAYTFGIDPK